jgi:hypothetical protein
MCFVNAWLLSRPAPASLCISSVSEALPFVLSFKHFHDPHILFTSIEGTDCGRQPSIRCRRTAWTTFCPHLRPRPEKVPAGRQP